MRRNGNRSCVRRTGERAKDRGRGISPQNQCSLQHFGSLEHQASVLMMGLPLHARKFCIICLVQDRTFLAPQDSPTIRMLTTFAKRLRQLQCCWTWIQPALADLISGSQRMPAQLLLEERKKEGGRGRAEFNLHTFNWKPLQGERMKLQLQYGNFKVKM